MIKRFEEHLIIRFQNHMIIRFLTACRPRPIGGGMVGSVEMREGYRRSVFLLRSLGWSSLPLHGGNEGDGRRRTEADEAQGQRSRV